MLKISLNEATVKKNSPIDKNIEIADRVGFDYIEIWLSQINAFLESKKIKDLKDLFAGKRIKPFALDSFEDVFFKDNLNYQVLKDEIKYACEICAELGIDRMVIVPNVERAINSIYSRKDSTDEAIKVLTELAWITAPYGVKLGLEPIGFDDCVIRSIEHATEIIKKVNLENVGLTLDVFNNYIFNELKDIDDISKIPKGKVFIYHVDDAKKMALSYYALDHSDRVFCGEGDLPIAEMTRKVLNTGYDGPISVELFNNIVYDMNSYEAIRLAYQTTKKIAEIF